ncbi:hypothetical protein P152DRAFT_484976 [Eremomyces bilateralis CBS 781.70]|uniref:Transcription initiation factor TFIID subunit 12 domain-containing protein n=1 Tax=Eremomyces bilateralis CBS 781.70 TaxID=1392243 RepID=A0A6G1FTF2_9PEZI|nr:uncharacterized protein P152DRAFT_484976 [Eremomyces bilateralis CBS 781.70]KAF1809044.1 hypothetical protein P152DRAFT_484976 [Eremomyces bilateralis CBS 781.70]
MSQPTQRPNQLPQGGATNPQHPQLQFIKPEQIKNMPHLDATQKVKYESGVRQMWAIIHSKPPDSNEYKLAMNKLAEATAKLKQNYRNWMEQKAKRSGEEQGAGTQPAQQPEQSGPSQPQGQPAQTSQQQIAQQVSKIPIYLPPGIPEHETEAKLKELRQVYMNYLMKMDQLSSEVRNYNTQIKHFQGQPQGPPQQIIDARQALMVQHQTTKQYIEEFQQKQNQYRKVATGQGGADVPVKTESGISQPSQGSGHPQGIVQMSGQPPNTGSQVSQPSSATKTAASPTQMSIPGQNQYMGQNMNPMARGHMTQGGPLVNVNQSMGAPLRQMPGQVQPQQQPQQQQQQQPQQQQQNPQGPGTQSLTHADAMERAHQGRGYPATDMRGPSHAGLGHPATTFEQKSGSKMPIPKTLNVASPAPVSMGPSRPTMAGPVNGSGGVMANPVISRAPNFVLEGEAERVLSKKKLDELVRQVTGGGEGVGNEGLTPEVEEAMLQLADEFVDSVISAGCRMAKLRESSTLEIRDLQLVLERNYNIRVPGYASDEIRTVRKVIPAPGWTSKMQAIQAAKVMGGKMDI